MVKKTVNVLAGIYREKKKPIKQKTEKRLSNFGRKQPLTFFKFQVLYHHHPGFSVFIVTTFTT